MYDVSCYTSLDDALPVFHLASTTAAGVPSSCLTSTSGRIDTAWGPLTMFRIDACLSTMSPPLSLWCWFERSAPSGIRTLVLAVRGQDDWPDYTNGAHSIVSGRYV